MKNNSVSKTRETLLQDVDDLKRTAAQVAQDVREHASAHVNETRARVADVADSLRENLTAHPLALVGVGFAIGFLVALKIRG